MARPKPKVFLDTSALIAGMASTKGAARELLRLAEIGLIKVVMSRQVIVEADRNISAKLPECIDDLRMYLDPRRKRAVRRSGNYRRTKSSDDESNSKAM